MSVEMIGGLFLGTLVSGLVPVVNAELLVVAAAGALASGALVPVAAVVAGVAASGQMVSKTLLFVLARRAPALLPRKARAAVEDASVRVSREPGAAWTSILTSATIGFPPFYGVSLAAGALGVRMGTFLTSGFLGRLARFAVLALGARTAGERLLNGDPVSVGALRAVALAVTGG